MKLQNVSLPSGMFAIFLAHYSADINEPRVTLERKYFHGVTAVKGVKVHV